MSAFEDHPRRHLAALVAAALIGLPASQAAARNAYVTNGNGASVSVINTATNTVVGSPITVGTSPFDVAISPDGSRAYVANFGSASVSVINTATNAVVGTPITVGSGPIAVAFTPDGAHAYTVNTLSASLSLIDTATNTVVGAQIPLGASPHGIAISPDGSRAYVADWGGNNNVTVINTATNAVVGSPIAVGTAPVGIAIKPDGSRAYVANYGGASVSVINTATNAVVGSPIATDGGAINIGMTPDGSRAYVSDGDTPTVSVINTATNAVVGLPITVGSSPRSVAITPDGSRAYVANAGGTTVSVINTATNATVGSPITVGNGPFGLAIKPNQGPVAGFLATPGGSPKKRAFSAAASADSDGTVARYDWDFGDGVTLPNGDATPSHTYAADGPYSVSLTVTDNEGCSDQVVFTGTTASCNGSAEATSTHQVDIDSVVDGASLSAKKAQKQKGKKIAVTVKLGAAEAVHVVANGKIKIAKKAYALKKLTKVLAAGGTATVKLKLKKATDAAKVATALRQGKKVTASPVAKFTDDAGNSTAKRKTVKLK